MINITNLINKLRSILYRYKFRKCGKNLKVLGKCQIWGKNILIGNNVSIYPGVNIWGDGEIVIGDNVAIGKDSIIFAKDSIIIENNVLIAGQSYIIDSDHNISKDKLIMEQGLTSKKILIKSDVWIGAGTKVLKGVTINIGAVIGANSLVNKNIEEYTINVGSPTKAIGFRKIK